MSGRSHIQAEEVHQAIVVQICEIAAHGVPRSVRERCLDDVFENAAALVFVEAIGVFEVIADIQVDIAVRVVVPPDGGLAMCVASDFRRVRDVVERLTVETKQVVWATSMLNRVVVVLGVNSEVRSPLVSNGNTFRATNHFDFFWPPQLVIKAVG